MEFLWNNVQMNNCVTVIDNNNSNNVINLILLITQNNVINDKETKVVCDDLRNRIFKTKTQIILSILTLTIVTSII